MEDARTHYGACVGGASFHQSQPRHRRPLRSASPSSQVGSRRCSLFQVLLSSNARTTGLGLISTALQWALGRNGRPTEQGLGRHVVMTRPRSSEGTLQKPSDGFLGKLYTAWQPRILSLPVRIWQDA